VLCDYRINNDRASRSASSQQCVCSFYSSPVGFSFLAKHHITQVCQHPYSPYLVPCDFWLFAKPKSPFFSREEVCECNGHSVQNFCQRRLTADWLPPRKSDCSRMDSNVSSDWLPSYIKATRPVLEIFKMARYFPDSLRILPFNTAKSGLLTAALTL